VSDDASRWVDVVQVDVRSAYGNVVDYLSGLGHRNIAFLGVVEGCYPSDASKLNSWTESMRSHGLCSDYRIPWIIGDARELSESGKPYQGKDFIYTPDKRKSLKRVV